MYSIRHQTFMTWIFNLNWYKYNIKHLLSMWLNITIINKIKCQSLHVLKVCHCSSQIWQNKTKSAIYVVEANGEDCVAHHAKKGDEGQDPSLWRRKVTFRSDAYSKATNMTFHEKQIDMSPVLSSILFQHLLCSSQWRRLHTMTWQEGWRGAGSKSLKEKD